MISILQEKKEEGTRSPAIGLSRSLYSENLNFLAPSGCPDWPFSLILFFPPSFTVFWDGLPPSSSFVFVSLFEPQAVE